MTNNTKKTFKNTVAAVGVALMGVSLVACSQTQAQEPKFASGANCGQLGDQSATLDRFYEPGHVVGAAPIKKQVFLSRAVQPTRTVGASLYVPAEPGMNAPHLHRVLACHAASGQAAHPNDPLYPESGRVAELVVRQAQNGFAVDIVANNPKVGEEIWRRAEALSNRGASVDVQQVSQGVSQTRSF